MNAPVSTAGENLPHLTQFFLKLHATGNTIPKEDFNKLFSAESVRKSVRGQGPGRARDTVGGYFEHDIDSFLSGKCLADVRNSDTLSDTASLYEDY